MNGIIKVKKERDHFTAIFTEYVAKCKNTRF